VTALIFRKETREMLRDKRVLSSAVFGPIFLILLFLVLFGFLQETLSKKKGQSLAIVAASKESTFVKALTAADLFDIRYVPDAKIGEEKVRTGAERALLEVVSEAGIGDGSIGVTKLRLTMDPDNQGAPIVAGRLEGFIRKVSSSTLAAIMETQGLSKDLAEPIQLERKEVKKEKAVVGSMILGLLPYLIVIWAFYGGMSIVSDLAAGEKEKNTLETLLIAPVSRVQIAMGKYWALFMVCLASSLTSLVAVLVVGSLNLPMTKGLFPEGVNLNPVALLATLGALLPLVAMFAGILLAISAYARNNREAQTHLTLVSFIVIMPAVFSQFIGFTDLGKQWWIHLVPVLNTAGVLREALLGKFEPAAFGMTVGSSLVLAYLAILLTVKLFNREEVLARI
jgi:sodium transport system permease protein